MRALIYNFLLLSNVSNDVKILFRVAKGREMSEKNRFFSRSGKSQRILYQVREILNSTSKSVKNLGVLF